MLMMCKKGLNWGREGEDAVVKGLFFFFFCLKAVADWE